MILNSFKSVFLKTHRVLSSLPVYLFVPLMILASFISIIPYALLSLLIGEDGNYHDDEAFLEMFIFACIAAPLIETAIFQSLTVYLLKRFTQFSSAWIVVLSAILFALAHSYSLHYMIHVLPVGLLLTYVYIIYLNKPHSAYWVVTCIHSLRNAVSVFFIFVL